VGRPPPCHRGREPDRSGPPARIRTCANQLTVEQKGHVSRQLLRQDVMPAVNESKTEVASLLGISRQHFHDILAEWKPVSPEVAMRLGKLFGNGAGPWIGMQGTHDEWRAAHAVDVSNIPTLSNGTDRLAG